MRKIIELILCISFVFFGMLMSAYAQDKAVFTIGTVKASGSTVDVPVYLTAIPEGLDNVMSIKFRYAYDANVLTYVSTTQGTAAGTFFLASDGSISWTDSTNLADADALVNPATVGASNPLFILTFQINGEQTSPTNITTEKIELSGGVLKPGNVFEVVKASSSTFSTFPGRITFDSSSSGETSGDNNPAIPGGSGSTGDNTTGDNTTGDNTTGDNTTGDNTTGDNTTGDNTTGDNTTGDNTTGDNTTGDNTTGDSTTGDSTTGDNTTGDNTTGDNTTGDSTTGGNSGGNNGGSGNAGGLKPNTNTGSGNSSSSGSSSSGGSSSGGSSSGGSSFGGGIAVLPQTPVETAPAKASEVFSDVADDHWAAQYALTLYNEGIVSGDSQKRANLDNQITREETAKLALLVNGIDVDSAAVLDVTDADSVSDWAKGFMATAVNNGIFSGYEDGTVRPQNRITREEMVTVIIKSLKIEVDAAASTSFSDSTQITWSAPYVAKAVELGFVNGYNDGSFKPGNPITRAEAFTIFARVLEYKNK
ncbi:MAG: S-layer homology domain-containing protein [Clostridia bacterium]|nr:S-layer homology domain-containing protein [Clostridia bacterium]